jgi:hypothetical protein
MPEIRSQRDFKGIWIPKEIWLSAELSLMEKVLFVEIHSLDNADGCYASNRYFAEFFGISDRQVSRYVAGLKEKGYVSVTVHNLNERIIRTTGRFARVPDSKLRQFKADYDSLVDKFAIRRRGYDRNVRGG